MADPALGGGTAGGGGADDVFVALQAAKAMMEERAKDRQIIRDLEDSNVKLTLLCQKLNQKLNLVMNAVDLEEERIKAAAETVAKAPKEAEALMCGYMNKKGRNVRNWKRRWFVLKGGVLSYYEDKGKTTVKGTIPLETCIIDGIKERENTGRPCMALIVEGRTLYCQAESKKENMAWYLAINCMQQQLDYTKKMNALFKEPDPRIISFFDHPMVTALALDNAPMPIEAAVALESSLRFHTGLVELSLKNTDLEALHFEPLSRALAGNKSLQIVHLEHNKLDAEAAKALGKALSKNESITELYLDDNPIGDEGLIGLSDALHSHAILRVLSMNEINVGDEGCNAFATSLSHSHVMPAIQLNGNKIGDRGAIGLANLLRINTSIESVHVQNNRIGPTGGLAFVDALLHEECNNVKAFEFGGNDASPELKQAYTAMLLNNQGLTSSSIGDIKLNAATISALRLLNGSGFVISEKK